MGERGPSPRSNSGRLRKNRDGQNVELTRDADLLIPTPRPEWHPLARQWFAGLEASPQSQLFQESDWAFAVLVAEQISDYHNLPPAKRQPAMWSAIMKAQDQLLVTHPARLRARVEVHDGAGELNAGEMPPNMIDLRSRFRERQAQSDGDGDRGVDRADSNAAPG